MEIERSLLAGTSFRNVAERHNLSTTALFRHKNEHLPVSLTSAKAAQEIGRADEVLEYLVTLQRRTEAPYCETQGVLMKAKRSGNSRIVLAAIRRSAVAILKDIEIEVQTLIAEAAEAYSLCQLRSPTWDSFLVYHADLMRARKTLTILRSGLKLPRNVA